MRQRNSLPSSFEPQIVFVSQGLIQGIGERLLSKPDFSELDVPFNRVAVVWRYQLQEHLLEAARDSGVEIYFNHRLENLHIVDGRAHLIFENGEAAEAEEEHETAEPRPAFVAEGVEAE